MSFKSLRITFSDDSGMPTWRGSYGAYLWQDGRVITMGFGPNWKDALKDMIRDFRFSRTLSIKRMIDEISYERTMPPLVKVRRIETPVNQPTRYEILPYRPKAATMTGAEFDEWCAESKPCRYCDQPFVGPSCPCEGV